MVKAILMTLVAPAKINLMLHILGRREDGYHLLQSAMAFADIGDRIALEPGKGFALIVEGVFKNHAPADETNLVARAVRVMEKQAGRSADVIVRLEKNIPAGAGLGGGSADAACVMHALNDLWGQPFTLTQLQAMGMTLGAELPVCLAGAAQWVEGIGELLSPLAMAPLDVVIVWPGVTLATADVFRAYAKPYSVPMRKPDAVTRDWLDGCGNDLRDAACALVPDVARAIAASGGRMSGSGSAVFAVQDSIDAAKETAAKLAAAYPEWWVMPARIG